MEKKNNSIYENPCTVQVSNGLYIYLCVYAVDLVVIGCGSSIKKVPESLLQELHRRRINVEALDTVSRYAFIYFSLFSYFCCTGSNN